MDMIALAATNRYKKVSPLYLRRMKKIPAVYYGHKEQSMALQVDYQEFRKAFKKAGGNQVVELTVDGKKKPVLIHEVQYNPLTDRIDHIDFLHVNMNEEVTAMIPIEILGVAPAVKNFSGILTTLKHEIEVRCLPANLPHSIQVDISGLEQLHNSIHIRDLQIPANVQVHGSPDDVVVTVVPPKLVEEGLPQAPTDEAATAEGAAPAATGAEGVPLSGGEAKAAPEAAKKEALKKE